MSRAPWAWWWAMCCLCLGLLYVGSMDAEGQAKVARSHLSQIIPAGGTLSVGGALYLEPTTTPTCASTVGVARTYRWDTVDDRMEVCMQVGGTWYWVPLTGHLAASTTLDAPNILAGVCDVQTYSPGGAWDDLPLTTLVECGPTFALGGGGFTECWLSAAGVISIKICNLNLLSALNPPSGTFAFGVDL